MSAFGARLVLVGAVCAAVTIAGIVVYLAAPTVEIGWYAYSPLPEVMPALSNPARDAQRLGGVVLAALGLAGASVTFGYVEHFDVSSDDGRWPGS